MKLLSVSLSLSVLLVVNMTKKLINAKGVNKPGDIFFFFYLFL